MTATDRTPTLVAYVPVLHKGYIDLFNRLAVSWVYVMDEQLIAEVPYLRKDLRALPPHQIVRMIDAACRGRTRALTVSPAGLRELCRVPGTQIVMPDEDISRAVAEKYLAGVSIVWESIFLRYDRQRTEAQYDFPCDREVPFEGVHARMMNQALNDADKSPDWWRQVGGVLVSRNCIYVAAHNTHALHDQIASIVGDPRGNFKSGLAIELSLAEHAESRLIAQAARDMRLSTEGGSIYLTCYPCPPCAKLMVSAGISKLYVLTGSYAMLDTAELFKQAGVEVIRVRQEK